ncbi:hybrid sensor histidine kinase/response regulator transcription factor [Pelobium manganitolerans]|uniref:hybrid sensor histidine kinase/response regulator transcription factor n=1 Tax=Pelobium manganitolerans TaxID=1842495 RepID=UPI003FA3AC3D
MSKKTSLLLFIFFMALNMLFAQPQAYNFSHLSIADGLSHNQVNTIYRDKQGFLWIGTLSGLNRFDGYDFKVFRHNPQDTTTLVDDYINNILEGPQQKLWIITRNGLNIYDPQNEHIIRNPTTYLARLRLPLDDELVDIKSADSTYWFLFRKKGIIRYQAKTSQTTLFKFGKNVKPVALAVSPKLPVWVICDNGDAVSIRQNRAQIFPKLFASFYRETEAFSSAFLDAQGEVYLFSTAQYKGVYHYRPQQKQLLHLSTANTQLRLNTNLVRGIVQDQAGKLWIATDHGGVNIYDKNKKQLLYLLNREYDQASISQNSINTVYKDERGFIWLGTFKKGISYYHPDINKFKTYTHQPSNANSLPYSDVNTFAEDKNGNIWIGTNGGGLLYWDRRNNTFKTYKHTAKNKGISSNVIVSLLIDDAQNLWIGSYHGGLDVFDGSNFRSLHQSTANADESVFSVKQSRSGDILVGTLDGGLIQYNPATAVLKTYTTANKFLASNYVSSILETASGELWLGTSEGIAVLKKSGSVYKESKLINSNNGLSNNNVNCLSGDEKGNIWIGTREGLNIYDTRKQTIKVYRRDDGLADNNIQAIQRDGRDDIWVSTSRGISRVHLQGSNIYKATFSSYDELDGLQGLEFNLNSAFLTSKGELIFGGANGFNIFKPQDIQVNQHQIRLAFTDFQVLNTSVQPSADANAVLHRAVNYAKEITLQPHQNVFSISFAGFNFFNPDKVRYAYQLEGFDKTWIDADHSARKATYTNLDAGDYLFKVKASINGLNSETPVKTVRIKVLPPFYETPLAYFIYTLLIISLLLYIRQRGIDKIRREFALQQERKEAQRVHDMDLMKIKFFTNVSHEFRTPLSLILAPIDKFLKHTPEGEEKQQYELIKRNAKRLLNLVNQLMDFRKMEVKELKLNAKKGNVVAFIRDLSFSFTDIAEKKQINFQFESEVENLVTFYDEEKLERIIFNLLSNAFKFTYENGFVSVHLSVAREENHDYLLIKIIDTGIGIPKESQRAIFENFFQTDTPSDLMNQGSGIGLSITKEFVELHGGEISVESEEEVGSCFTVKLPVEVIAVGEKKLLETQKTKGKTERKHSDDTALKKPLVLLVEDNEDFRFYLKENLNGYFRISEACDGQEGWQKVLSLQPQLVVSDISMPRLGGIDLCRKIKDDERTKKIPVVLLTAQTGEENHLKGLDTGASDYMTKPFNFEILLSKLKNILQQQQSYISTYKKQVDVSVSTETLESTEEKLVRNALELVEKNILNPNFSVEEMSRELHMSRVALYKKLLSITGQSPVAFIRTIRLQKAKHLIESSDLSLSEIAYRVGFSNPKYFTKSFKQEYGVTPSEWQKASP